MNANCYGCLRWLALSFRTAMLADWTKAVTIVCKTIRTSTCIICYGAGKHWNPSHRCGYEGDRRCGAVSGSGDDAYGLTRALLPRGQDGIALLPKLLSPLMSALGGK